MSLIACSTAIAATPSARAAAAATCAGADIVERGGAVLRADRLRPYGGMTCRTARVVVRRFLRRQLSHFRTCAARAANGGLCRVGDYYCSKTPPRSSSCAHDELARGVRFRERDAPNE